MYGKSRKRRVVLKDGFDVPRLKEIFEKFENRLEGKKLTTFYNEQQICVVEVSDIYYNFDFSEFCQKILDEIPQYFQPDFYGILIHRIQEVRLIGGKVMIGNDEYKKILSIVNSTDKSRALSMNIGLVLEKRGKYNPNETRTIYSILTAFHNRHYKASLPDKVKEFSENLVNFNMKIEFHIKTIEDLASKKILFKDFIKSILFKDDGSVIKTVELKLRALGKKLTDEYDLNHNILQNMRALQFDKCADFEIDAKTIYDAYSELFTDSDAAIISRENRRAIEALDKCEDKS